MRSGRNDSRREGSRTMRIEGRVSSCLVAWVAIAAGGPVEARQPGLHTEWPGPALVSPGDSDHEGDVSTPCPTFSWAEIPNAVGYEVRVYEAGGEAAARGEKEPVLRAQLPAGAFSWTPELRDGLEPGRYAWVVGATIGGGIQARWSRPALFRVVAVAAPGGNKPKAAPIAAPAPLGAVAPARPAPAARAPAGMPAPRALVGEAYTPPLCGAAGMFADVPVGDLYCRWIEQLARDGIADDCGGGNYCPKNAVTREQLAMVVERAMRGTATWHPAQGSNVLAPPANNSRTRVDPGTNVGEHSSITVGADGLPIISYAGGGLLVAHCNDVACAGSDETITTVEDVGTVLATSIAIGANGLPVIGYTIAVAAGNELRVLFCNDVACAGHDETSTTVDGPTNYLVDASLAIGADGLPIVAYRRIVTLLLNDDLKVAHCDNADCTNHTVATVDDRADIVGVSPSLAIGTDGLPIISYAHLNAFNKGSLVVTHCDDFKCEGNNEATTTVDDPANSVGLYSSLAIGTDGLPIMSYFDGTAGMLLAAHCSDLACAVALTPTPITSVFAYTSLAIGADGLPIIAFQSANGGNGDALKTAHCNDLSCAGGDETIVAVEDQADVVGRQPAMTIGVDGLPIISHQDLTLTTLRVAHCSNAFCTPYFRRR